MAPSSVVVTGCGSGIGRAIITRLAADGWRAAGIEINADDAASIREELGASHAIIEGDAADRAILAKARMQPKASRRGAGGSTMSASPS
jgi:NAD(P)-dependent dehydrogenase (short-subunit alcohol dehydrogenase family)